MHTHSGCTSPKQQFIATFRSQANHNNTTRIQSHTWTTLMMSPVRTHQHMRTASNNIGNVTTRMTRFTSSPPGCPMRRPFIRRSCAEPAKSRIRTRTHTNASDHHRHSALNTRTQIDGVRCFGAASSSIELHSAIERAAVHVCFCGFVLTKTETPTQIRRSSTNFVRVCVCGGSVRRLLCVGSPSFVYFLAKPASSNPSKWEVSTRCISVDRI